MFIKTKDGVLQMSVMQSTFVIKILVYFAFRNVFITNIRLKLCYQSVMLKKTLKLNVFVFLLLSTIISTKEFCQ